MSDAEQQVLSLAEELLAAMTLEEQPLFLLRLKRRIESRWTQAMEALDERNAEKNG